MEERRRLSTTSRFSSPGTPKIRSTPSFSRAATRTSDPFIFGSLAWEMLEEFPRDRGGYKHEDERPPSRGAMRPRFAGNFLTLQSEGAGNTGCTLHPRSRVQQCTKKRTRAYRFSGGNPAFPAQWFTAYFALSPVTGLSCHRHPREVLLPANLTPASGRQDHTASPSATAAFVIRRHRVHRTPPRVRDDREPPLSSGETGGAIEM